ncbi:MAG: SDR family oxidoreductase [Caldilineaceae bacterium]
MNASMQGKTVLVTGATAGIGQVTVRELARMGATVVGIGRNPQKCAEVAAQIRSQTGNTAVEYLVADLSLLREIRKVTETFKSRYNRLDVLVNNAGAFYQQRQVTAEGFEMTFALNHLNYFLLTQQLLDLLSASAPARIVNVSSDAHKAAKFDLADLQMEKKYSGWTAYANSKLANIFFTYELARRLAGSKVTVNTLHPGFVDSNFALNNNQGTAAKVFLAIFKPLRNLIAVSVDKGAETSIFLASSPAVEGETSKYFVNKQAVRSSSISYDTDVAQRLWDITERHCNHN